MALFSNSEQNIVEALKQELSPIGAEMKEGIASIRSALESLNQRLDALEQENLKLRASVALKKDQLEDESSAKASQRAAELLAANGHQPITDKPEDGEEKPSILEQYAALSGAEQRKFYESHKEELIELCK